MKACIKCGKSKPLSEYHRRGSGYRNECKPCRAEIKRIWRAKNSERLNEYNRQWKRNNPEMVRARKRHRRAVLAGVPSEVYTVDEILSMYGSHCHICGEGIDLKAPRGAGSGSNWERGLHLDHVIPLSKGGHDLASNVMPAHALCNLRKGDN